MPDLAAFPITRKWPAQHPDRIQLYSLPTPNGVKVSIMLEETGLPYEPHLVRFDANDQLSPEFLSLNPNNKIPAIIDPDGPGGQPLALFESGAILLYLADKTGTFLPRDGAARYQTIQWLMFQMGGIGPMFGQVGFFHKFAGKDYEDKRPRDRYVGGVQAPARACSTSGSRTAPGSMGDELHHRRHRDLSVGAQPRRLLRRGRAGGDRRLPQCHARARCVRDAPGVVRGLEIPKRT